MIKKVFFFSAVCSVFFHSFSVFAFESEMSFSLGTGESNLPRVTQKANEAVLYNFSAPLLSAIENCTPYQEDFTEHNPSLKEKGALFGGSLQVNAAVKGQENNACAVSVTIMMGGFGKTLFNCSVGKEQQQELVSAMKDRSMDLITETFTSVNRTDEGNGEIQESKQITTMTDTKFNIVYSKLIGSACIMKQEELTPEEEENAKKEFDALSENFLTALQTCSAQKTSRKMLFISQTAEITGMKNDKCQILIDTNFILSLPPETAKTIKDWESLENLAKDKQFSTFNYKNNYTCDGLMALIGSCEKNNGECSNSSSSSSSAVGSISTRSGVNSSGCSSESCSFKFLNTVSIDEQETNYSIICDIPKTEITKIASDYADLIEKYGAKSGRNDDGSFWGKSAESNDETRAADKKILKYIQSRRMCRYEQKPD